MAIVNPDLLKDPFVFNSDRNNWMAGGGVHTWSADAGTTHTWSFTTPLFICWLAGRSTGSASHQGVATYNQVPAQSIPIPLDSVVYVTLDADNNATLGITVCAGTALPQSDNIFVLCSHRNVVATPNLNPLMMRWGNSIGPGQSYNATSGFPTLGFAGNYSGVTWTVTHSLSSTDVLVECLDNGTPRNVIWPQNIAITDANNVTITWSSSVTGRVIVMKIT